MFQLIKSSLLFLLLDSIFIYLNRKMFMDQIKVVQGSPLQVNIVGTILSYVFLLLGLNYFILREHRSVFDAFVLGLVIYGVYESTTYALLKNWNIRTVITDTLWGGILFGTTTYLTYRM